MDRRLLAVIALAVAGALLFLAAGWDAPAGGSGTVALLVEGPDGVIWNGTVDVTDATPFRALQAASVAGDFAVDSTGSGDQVFVSSIAGHANEGVGGWCYAVWDDGWFHPPVSAGAWGLEDGARVWWHYEAEGCPV